MKLDKEGPNIEVVRLVMEERRALTEAGKELLEILQKHHADRPLASLPDTKAELEVEKKILDISNHLANMAGFCDPNGKRAISVIKTRILDVAMVGPQWYFEVKILLPSIIGIDVDYTKKPPFKVIGLNVKALGAQLKGYAKR